MELYYCPYMRSLDLSDEMITLDPDITALNYLCGPNVRQVRATG